MLDSAYLHAVLYEAHPSQTYVCRPPLRSTKDTRAMLPAATGNR